MGDRIQAPLFFPCAHRVTIPQVGSDETELTPRRTIALDRPLLRVTKQPETISSDYLKKVSTGISFSEDVVKDRCFHLLPYDAKFHRGTYDVPSTFSIPKRPKMPPGRHNQRGSDNRHLPCHIEKRVAHKLKPIKRPILKKVAEMHKEALEKENKERKESFESLSSQPAVFITELSAQGLPSEDEVSQPVVSAPTQRASGKQQEWDSYLLTRLSENTAQWLVKRQTSPGPHQDNLRLVYEKYHGVMTEGEVELIEDTVSEMDFPVKTEYRSKKWRKGDATLLDKVREITLSKSRPTDPYCDDSGAAFYRLPAGFRRAKKHKDKEEEAAINTTAYNIEVTPYEAPPLKTLKDVTNPRVGKTLCDSNNLFIQEWLIGQEQVHQKMGDKTRIVMDSNNKYHKVLQRESPRKPQGWYPPGSADKRPMSNEVGKYERGLHRWTALPEPIDDTAENLGLVAIGADGDDGPNSNKPKRTASSGILVQIVDDWRAKWHLDMRYADASPDDLIADMADLHPHIRLKAITTCARAAEYKPPPQPGIQLDETEVVKQSKLLPEELFVALECCLDDSHDQVKRAAAIALYSLERPVPKAEEILRITLKDEKSSDRWTASQCLAFYGECDSDVVGELVSTLLNTEDVVRHDQAARLLARLSENSTLVHSMLAEQLNSTSWRHRCMACQVIPKLYGHINKDLASKLTQLMWSDWHSEVRKSAAQTLGRTGHGKDVHDELRERIISGNERNRVEAVSRVGQLGIMTAKLMPVFLQCFTDNYVSVRMETCISCAHLKIGEEQILERLLHLATYDPIWKVKALAIQALGRIGVVTDAVRECVLWAFRYEDQEGVRAEACHTINVLQLQDDDVAQMLQDRYLVEPSHIVKEEISLALGMCGILPSEDMDMVARVKSEVRKLCNRDNICAQITLDEKEEQRKKNLQRMIFLSEQDKDATADDDDNNDDVANSICFSGNKGPATKSVAFHPLLRDKERAESVRSEAKSLRSLRSRMAPRAHTASSSKSDASSAYNREHSALTPVADREVEAIITGDRDAMTPSTRSGTALSQKSHKSFNATQEKEDDSNASPAAEIADLNERQEKFTSAVSLSVADALSEVNAEDNTNEELTPAEGKSSSSVEQIISSWHAEDTADDTQLTAGATSVTQTDQVHGRTPPTTGCAESSVTHTKLQVGEETSEKIGSRGVSASNDNDHLRDMVVAVSEPTGRHEESESGTVPAVSGNKALSGEQTLLKTDESNLKACKTEFVSMKSISSDAASFAASGATSGTVSGTAVSESTGRSIGSSKKKSREKKKADSQEMIDPETAVSKYSAPNMSTKAN